MCGIVGLFRQTPGTVNPEEIRRTLDRMRHRGPDDEGYLAVRMSDGKVVPCGGRDSERRLDLPDLEIARGGGFNLVLGHRRLSIIDLSESGHQPMASADSRFWIVYNGELYNYVELRAELAAKGHPFRTETDTEVILAAYREWGAAMLGRFIGMFAFAILDLDEAKLFMARDFFGIKPLYYAVVGNQFAFASEIKAVLEIPGVARNADPQRLYEYLRFANTDSR